LAISAGLKSARITPLDGLAFLISAITADLPSAQFFGGYCPQNHAQGLAGCHFCIALKLILALAAATSMALVAKILFNISLIFIIKH
jgi:hypothetical protein